ncbi:MAG: DUF4192 family protein, partial [Herbiconiux sp.]|nr:DUF4192 family protein [Herbiconiux sp.]
GHSDGAEGHVGEPAPVVPCGAAPQTPDVHHGVFVPIEPIPRRRTARALATLGALDESAGPDAPDPVDELLRWQAELDARLSRGARPTTPDRPGDALAIALARSLHRAVVRDCVLMLCGWGAEAAQLALHEAGRPPRGPDDPDSVFDAYLGSSHPAPNPQRVRCAIELLRRVVACAPDPITAPALTVLAWLEWSRGRGSVAGHYLDAAVAIDPHYRLAHLFGTLLGRGCIPEWLE